MNIVDMLDDIASLGVRLAQICDLPGLDAGDSAALAELRAAQHRLSLSIEIGTRGVQPERLLSYVAMASELDASLVRTVPVPVGGEAGGTTDIVACLRRVLPAFAERGVTLGLETYEGLSVDDIVAIVEEIDSPYLGIVLDPGNPIGRLEHPADTMRRCLPHTVSLHIKDVEFVRNTGSVGLLLQGCALGRGVIHYEAFLSGILQNGRNPNVIIEHWLPLGPDLSVAQESEARYVPETIDVLRNWGVSS